MTNILITIENRDLDLGLVKKYLEKMYTTKLIRIKVFTKPPEASIFINLQNYIKNLKSYKTCS